MTKLSTFSLVFLHPRYWITWIGIGLLWFLVQLPYPVIFHIGCGLGLFARHIMRRRAKIVNLNLKLSFPKMSKNDLNKMEISNFKSVGMGLMETGMAWFWSDKRIIRWMDIAGVGMKPIKEILEKKRGILLIGIHFLTLEIGARMFGIHIPGIGVYRPNNNLLLNWIQTWGRLRSNKSMLDRKDLKSMVRALKSGEIVWYAPDHDYGVQSSVFVSLFSVKKVATTAGVWILARMSKAAIVPFVPRRKPKGEGYELIILDPECEPPLDNAKMTTEWINRIVEKCILLAPDQYMWLHRRFKTRPKGMPAYYRF